MSVFTTSPVFDDNITLNTDIKMKQSCIPRFIKNIALVLVCIVPGGIGTQRHDVLPGGWYVFSPNVSKYLGVLMWVSKKVLIAAKYVLCFFHIIFIIYLNEHNSC